MEKRRRNKSEGRSTEVNAVAVLCNDNGKIIPVCYTFEVNAAGTADAYFCIWAQIQKLFERAGVIRFAVVEHDIFDFTRITDTFYGLYIL